MTTTPEGFENIEVTLTLTVQSDMNPRAKERLREQLLGYGHTLPGVVEAGISPDTTTLTRSKLLLIWNEVVSAVPTVMGMAPADSVWGGMTCTEAEALASIFGAAGHTEVEDFIIGQHALGDDDPEDTHHEQFLTARQEGRA